ncbi:AI-2E family transporter [Nakamurella deserti]|uniref:AI-2E family transporter n=1 Tax=Nakamurella deserti TaxID=2164074 RepID=UPI000DBE661B|nr:AI-2E family transporter [Nakamurella deserti]
MDEQRTRDDGKDAAPVPDLQKAPAGRGGVAARRQLEKGVVALFRWTLRVLVIAAGLWLLGWLVGQLWSIVLPVLLALLLSTVLWPPVRFMRRKLPAALSALAAVLGLIVVIGGLIALFVPVISNEGQNLASQFSSGLESLQNWLSGPPLNLGDNAVGTLLDQAVSYLQENAQDLAGTALTTIGTIGSAVVTIVFALLFTFFMLKDGPRFLPWLRGWIGRGAGRHVGEVSGRVWTALGHYVWSQAAVAAIDGVLIGLGVWIVGVPLALPIAVLTFFGGFIPIVGAFAAGAVAVLVALVTKGVVPALIVLAIIVVVQQLEGNVLQPILVSKSLKIHAAVVLGGVALGSTLFGVVGAFLAVPAIAIVMVVANYLREQVVGRPAGEAADAD